MKQESRFVAELYRYLAPFIDATRELYVSLDGQAARSGVQGGQFTDPDVPDLWFYLVGSPNLTLIEAKVLDPEGRLLVGRGQLGAWRTTGAGAHKPAAWVVADVSFTGFHYWTHAAFCAERLDASNSRQDYTPFKPPAARVSFPDIRQLALHVLRQG